MSDRANAGIAVALLAAAFFAAADAAASCVSVAFDAALTNQTEWTYGAGFEYVSSQKAYGFKANNGGRDQVVSPVFDFAVTSVAFSVRKAGPGTSRNLLVRPVEAGVYGSSVELVPGAIPSDATEFTASALWPAEAAVRQFALLNTSGGGNLYVLSAEILGVPFVDSPCDAAFAEVGSTKAVLRWANPANAASNRVDLYEIDAGEASFVTRESYDFSFMTNSTSSPVDCGGLLESHAPCLSGSFLYKAANSAGVLQISTTRERGALLYSGSVAGDGAALLVSAKKHPTDVEKAYGLSVEWIDSLGVTNNVGEIPLSAEFPPHPAALSLDGVAPDARILFQPTGTDKSNRRILVDDIAFVENYSPAHCTTNLARSCVVSGVVSVAFRRLSPGGTYFAAVRAFDAQGRPSEGAASAEAVMDGRIPGLALHLR